MKISKHFNLLSFILFLVGCNTLLGQYYWFEENESYDNGFSVVWTTLIGGEIKFSNLGIIDIPEIEGVETNSQYMFNDGYINTSSFGGDMTSDFGFNMNNALVNTDGFVDSFRLNGYGSQSSGAGRAMTPKTANGWEVRYDRNFYTAYNDQFSIGVRAGFGFNNYDASFANSINGNLLIQTATVDIPVDIITYVPEESYTNPVNGPAININDDIDLTGLIQVTQETIEDGVVNVPSEIDGRYETDSFLGMAHLGVTFQMPIWDHFSARISTGVHMTEAYSRFTTDQVLVNAVLVEDISVITAESRTDSLLGFYGEINVQYSIRDSSFFLGMRHSRNDEYEPLSSNGMTSTLEIGNTTQMQAGFMHKF